MTSVNVQFEVSKEILQGLNNGTYERIGGVIRKTGGKKEIFCWLSESGNKISDSGIPELFSSPQLLMGLQVANLAVSAIGFAMVYQKLQKVETILHGIENKLVDLERGQNWLDKKLMIDHLAPIISAIKSVQSYASLQDQATVKHKLISADDKLSEGDEYFRQTLGRMLAEKLENERPEEFAACYRAWVMANQGKINAMVALNERQLAIERVKQFKIDHGDFGKQFRAIRQDPIRRIEAGEDGRLASKIFIPLTDQMIGVHDIIKGNVLELEYLEENNLTLPNPNNYRNKNENDYYVYSCFQPLI